MLIKTSVLSLSLALFVGVAAAQASSWPIVNGRSSMAVTSSRPNSRSTAREMTGRAKGVVESSRRPTPCTTRLCADLRWRWME